MVFDWVTCIDPKWGAQEDGDHEDYELSGSGIVHIEYIILLPWAHSTRQDSNET